MYINYIKTVRGPQVEKQESYSGEHWPTKGVRHYFLEVFFTSYMVFYI